MQIVEKEKCHLTLEDEPALFHACILVPKSTDVNIAQSNKMLSKSPISPLMELWWAGEEASDSV